MTREERKTRKFDKSVHKIINFVEEKFGEPSEETVKYLLCAVVDQYIYLKGKNEADMAKLANVGQEMARHLKEAFDHWDMRDELKITAIIYTLLLYFSEDKESEAIHDMLQDLIGRIMSAAAGASSNEHDIKIIGIDKEGLNDLFNNIFKNNPFGKNG